MKVNKMTQVGKHLGKIPLMNDGNFREIELDPVSFLEFLVSEKNLDRATEKAKSKGYEFLFEFRTRDGLIYVCFKKGTFTITETKGAKKQ